MKLRKSFLIILGSITCIIVLVFRILAITGIFALFMDNPQEPEIKYGEFPISVIYEINGEKRKLEDIVVCEYDNIEKRGSAGNYRKWKARLKSGSKNFGFFPIEKDEIMIEVGIYIGSPNYYMGDYEQTKEEYERVMDDDRFREYVEWKDGIKTGNIYSKDEVWKKYGFKIIDIQYSQPIKNTFK